jgi:hypothetical protein
MDTITAISTVGFPIVACLYAWLRFEKKLDLNTDALNQLKLLISEKLKN